jgi:hypothetical protein
MVDLCQLAQKKRQRSFVAQAIWRDDVFLLKLK